MTELFHGTWWDLHKKESLDKVMNGRFTKMPPDGLPMLVGARMSGNPRDAGSREVPRGPNDRALIGDPRNDENRIVAQLHAIFLRFHNQVAKHLGGKGQLREHPPAGSMALPVDA